MYFSVFIKLYNQPIIQIEKTSLTENVELEEYQELKFSTAAVIRQNDFIRR